MSGAGAFLIEVIITAVFVLVVLTATRKEANVAISGAVIGLGLLLANLVATPIDGASVNPARSFGPALVTAGQPIRQVWLFILAPLVGAVLAAGVYLLFHPWRESEAGARAGFSRQWGQSAVSSAGAEEGTRPAGVSSTTASGTAAAPAAPAPKQHSTGQHSTGQPAGAWQRRAGRWHAGQPARAARSRRTGVSSRVNTRSWRAGRVRALERALTLPVVRGGPVCAETGPQRGRENIGR